MTDLRTRLRLTIGHAANLALARPPRFAVLATPRAGTAFAARYLTLAGLRCSHEGYFTPEGPRLLNPDRRFGSKGEVSWVAVPFAAEADMVLFHQVREPMAVVRSIVKSGFFDPRMRSRYRRYLRFVEQHFEWGPDAVESAVRFTVEWNRRAERHAAIRYSVEDIESALPAFRAFAGARALVAQKDVPADVNARPPVLGDGWDEALDERIHAVRGFDDLAAMSRRYGY